MKKIVIPLIIVAMALVICLIGFCVYGIISFFSDLGEADDGYEKAVEYMQSVPKGEGVAYEEWDALYFFDGEIAESYESITIQLVDKSYIYYKLFSNEKEAMYRADHDFKNEELLLEVDRHHELEMIDSNTILYYKQDNHNYYAYHIDTAEFVRHEKVDGYSFIYDLLKYGDSPYEIEEDYRGGTEKITVTERATGKSITLDREHFKCIGENEHIKKVTELSGGELEFSRITRHEDGIYIDFVMREPSYGYQGIVFTFELDFESEEYTLLSWHASSDYDYSYTHIY